MKNILLASIALIGFSSATAFAEPPSFNQFELGYGVTKYGESDQANYDGLTARGSYEFLDNLYVTGSFSDQSQTEESDFGDEFDYTSYTVGAGFYLPLGEKSAFYLEANLAEIEIESGDVSYSEDGYVAAAGIRSMVSDKFEIYSELSHLDYDSSATNLSAGGRYYFTNNVGVFAEVSRSDFDANHYMVGASIKF